MIPDSVRKALRTRRIEDRIAAVEALAGRSDPEVTTLLLEALRDRSHYVATLAARALGDRRDAVAVPAMVEHFAWLAEDGKQRDPGCRVRNELAVAFGRCEDPRAAEVLFAGMRTVQVEPDGPGLSDMATSLRANCALAIGQIRPPGALLALSLLLFDTLPLFDDFEKVPPARAAAEALSRLGDPSALAPLAIMLTHGPDLLVPASAGPFRAAAVAEILVACMDAVVAMEREEAVELLAPFLHPGARPRQEEARRDREEETTPDVQGPQVYLCASAALALARTRKPQVLPLLRQCLDTAPAEALEAVAIALANLRSGKAREALIEAAGHARPPVRAAAAAGLAVFPDEEVLALLRRMADKDTHRSVRDAARRALA